MISIFFILYRCKNFIKITFRDVQMADLYEKCLNDSKSVHKKMDSNMIMIRQLDVKFAIKEEEAKQKLLKLVSNWKKLSKVEQARNYEAVQACFAEAKELSTRKVSLASDTYELVDTFIQKLDNDTSKFNSYITYKQLGDDAQQQTPSTSSISMKAIKSEPKSLKRRRSTMPTSSASRKSVSRRKEHDAQMPSTSASYIDEPTAMASVVSSHGDMPVDPNEPKYCICQEVSFGNMVGCDNKNCPLEWFHFTCVGLTSSPKGKWFCPQCSDNKDVKKLQQKTPKSKNRGKNVQE